MLDVHWLLWDIKLISNPTYSTGYATTWTKKRPKIGQVKGAHQTWLWLEWSFTHDNAPQPAWWVLAPYKKWSSDFKWLLSMFSHPHLALWLGLLNNCVSDKGQIMNFSNNCEVSVCKQCHRSKMSLSLKCIIFMSTNKVSQWLLPVKHHCSVYIIISIELPSTCNGYKCMHISSLWIFVKYISSSFQAKLLLCKMDVSNNNDTHK